MTRVRVQKPVLISCSDDSWQEIIAAMNKATDEVSVSRAAWDDVWRCHDGRSRPLMRCVVGRSRVRVNRADLFAFAREHGRLCGKR